MMPKGVLKATSSSCPLARDLRSSWPCGLGHPEPLVACQATPPAREPPSDETAAVCRLLLTALSRHPLLITIWCYGMASLCWEEEVASVAPPLGRGGQADVHLRVLDRKVVRANEAKHDEERQGCRPPWARLLNAFTSRRPGSLQRMVCLRDHPR